MPVDHEWWDKLQDLCLKAMNEIKVVIHDKSIPWEEREKRAMKVLKRTKQAMVDCRPTRLVEKEVGSDGSSVDSV